MTTRPTQRLLRTYGAVLFVFLGASAALTPLYPLYQAQWHVPVPMLQAAFAIYALTLLAALLCLGALSDHIGRRPVALAAIAIEMLAMLQCATATGIDDILRGRALQGLATGIATSALSAGLQDADRARGGLIGGMVPMGSMAGFALASAVLARFAPHPLRLVFVLILVALALAVPAILSLPETVSPMPGALASLRPRVHVPRRARGAMLTVAPANIAVWALSGLLLSLGPAVARLADGGAADPLLGGWVIASVMGAALAAMMLHRRGDALALLRRGAILVLAGLPVALLGLHARFLAMFLLGGGIAGAGLGLVVQGSLRMLVPLAHVHERAGLMASYFVLSYLAFCAPAFAAGFAVRGLGLMTTTDLYVALLIGLTGATLRALPRPDPAGTA
ncbi:MFS transporter [Gluconacetobacter tumulicola]|uniref:MFS transporter n=1 Tax=Gluconacetobacter tumulicola TaxID=1017177 RepID=A0A7W4JGR8_9PROT|nr:MFS transporter [Gluconacetobacter tumulicola]MBB2180967.1 MFS transporter [Gluconacetobacter tumulicola]